MTSPVAADLEILFLTATPDGLERAREALRAFRLIGYLDVDEGAHAAVSGALAFIPGRGLVVAEGETIASTPAQPIIDALSARLNATVFLSSDDSAFSAEPADADVIAEEEAGDVGTDARGAAQGIHLFVVGGKLALAPDRRAELALQLESPLTVVPSTANGRGARTLVVMHDPQDSVYWTRAQRPVIGLRQTANQLEVQVFSTVATRTGRMRERIANRMMPDWIGLWDPAPMLIIDDPGDSEGSTPSEGLAVQRGLIRQRAEVLTGLGISDAEVLAETGIDEHALRAVLAQPLSGDDTTVRAVAAALRIPPDAVAILTEQSSASELTGATEIEQRSIGGTISESLLAEPQGTSLWARWRQLPHRHPRVAVALVVGELAVAGIAAVLAGTVVSGQPWSIALWTAAALLAVDAIGDAILLRRIRRRG